MLIVNSFAFAYTIAVWYWFQPVLLDPKNTIQHKYSIIDFVKFMVFLFVFKMTYFIMVPAQSC